MSEQKDFQCPNCAKLWDRIEKLEAEKAVGQNEKAKTDRLSTLQLAASVCLLTLIVVSFLIQLLT